MHTKLNAAISAYVFAELLSLFYYADSKDYFCVVLARGRSGLIDFVA